ncbi:hypothetical protein BSL78_14981 [Apostichopus japonicus]|uniref:Uncharacterized protein n=1 Tax=Stichopus japonicus TaxID=307972 RepID=A0A2G8KJH5_STIJA|nr:hypothetical protein BSL78_14981 [Apostichopus japonicus]
MIELGPEINGPIKEVAVEAEVSSEEPSSIESIDTAGMVPYAIFSHLGGKSVDLPPKMEMPNTDYTSSKSQTKATESSTTVSKNEEPSSTNSSDTSSLEMANTDYTGSSSPSRRSTSSSYEETLEQNNVNTTVTVQPSNDTNIYCCSCFPSSTTNDSCKYSSTRGSCCSPPSTSSAANHSPKPATPPLTTE